MMEINKFYQGSTLKVLRTFPDNCIDCCVTSPPYWGLRDYGTGMWVGGSPECNHRRDTKNANPDWAVQTRGKVDNGVGDEIFKDVCRKCGAIRVDEQIGLEKTPEEFIHKLVLIFREVRRVLKPTGTLWINIADTYWGGKGMSGSADPEKQKERNESGKSMNKQHQQMGGSNKMRPQDGKHAYLKPKDLCMIPARLAIALQMDGWWLRSDIIWSKPNPMPESVTDRPTKAHEYIFLLSKCQHYYYDEEAIKEIANYDGRKDTTMKGSEKYQNGYAPTTTVAQSIALKGHERWKMNDDGDRVRNKRSVWTIAPKPFAEAHFATFPEELVEPCIKAGSSEYGCCSVCGSPYQRIVKKTLIPTAKASFNSKVDERDLNADKQDQGSNRQKDGHKPGWINKSKTKGWKATCKCHAPVVKSVVLDCFSGAGTTFIVAEKLNRDRVAIELNPDYIKISEDRRYKEIGLFANV